MQSITIPWIGQVSPLISKNNATEEDIHTLNPGLYRIKFSALKHFGNPEKSGDFDIYFTPPFDLVF